MNIILFSTMRIPFYLYLTLVLSVILTSCMPVKSDLEEIKREIEAVNQVVSDYPTYKEVAISTQRFKHSLVDSLLTAFAASNEAIGLKEEGISFEGRSIKRLTIGTGPTSVLMWSQMHGDEPTATMALFDLLHFLTAKDDTYNQLRARILSKLTIHLIPMLNPDGAERFRRRNAQGIDMNRDALHLQTLEGQILKRVRDYLDADFAFNLHDQSRYYRVGDTDKAATISFLAPAYNEQKSVNAARSKAKKVIAVMNDMVQMLAPGHVGRYDDTFEPRAFGDNIAKWGSSTILIESGGFPDDPEKQEVRRFNFAALVAGLQTIASESYQAASIATYYGIPENSSGYLQLLLENLTIENPPSAPYTIDLGFRHREVNQQNAQAFYLKGSIEDMGDLSTWTAYQKVDVSGLILRAGKSWNTTKSIAEWTQTDILEALKQGYTYFPIPSTEAKSLKSTPLSALFFDENGIKPRMGELHPGVNPAFYLVDQQEVVKYVVLNAFLIDVSNPVWPNWANGLVLNNNY